MQRMVLDITRHPRIVLLRTLQAKESRTARRCHQSHRKLLAGTMLLDPTLYHHLIAWPWSSQIATTPRAKACEVLWVVHVVRHIVDNCSTLWPEGYNFVLPRQA